MISISVSLFALSISNSFCFIIHCKHQKRSKSKKMRIFAGKAIPFIIYQSNVNQTELSVSGINLEKIKFNKTYLIHLLGLDYVILGST